VISSAGQIENQADFTMRSPKDSPKRSSSKRSFSVKSWLLPWGKTVEPETGPIIHRSWNKTLRKIAFAGLAAGGGVGIACISIGAATQAWAKKPEYLILILLALALFALIGLFLLAIGALLIFVYVQSLFHKERFILGRCYLQCLFGTTKANMQLPFDNIQKIAWATKTEPNGVDYPYIGIDLVDPMRDDTIINPVGLEGNRQNFGFDQIILDDYEIPLQTLFDQLIARWDEVTRAASKGEDGDERPLPRRRQPRSKGLSRNLIGSIIVAGVLLLFLGFGGITLLFIGREFMNRPVAPVNVTGNTEIDKALADLENKNQFVCQAGADRLAGMQPNEHRAAVVKKLAGLTQVADAFSRKANVRALGVWATPSEVPILIRSLDDPDLLTRHEALNAIGRFKDQRSLAPVMRCFLDPMTRTQAEKALREIGPMAEKEVLSHLNHPDVLQRQSAIRVLADIGSQQSVPALEPLASGDDVFLKGPAREALMAVAARTKK
jgi:hypothetical protein